MTLAREIINCNNQTNSSIVGLITLQNYNTQAPNPQTLQAFSLPDLAFAQ
jgi:hypothetical protein